MLTPEKMMPPVTILRIAVLSIFLLLLNTVTLFGQYCSVSSTTCDEYISLVSVGGINNTSNCTTSPINGYHDYTSISTDMSIGVGYNISVTNGQPWQYDECAIWIDWNQDHDFNDPNEQIVLSNGTGLGPYQGTITPPIGAAPGATRIRIRIVYNSTPSPCGNSVYGETEDYTINVIGSGPMTYQSTIVTQPNTSGAPICESNLEILRIEVKTSGVTSPLDISNFVIQTNGSTSPAILNNVSNIDLFYTGSSPEFSAVSLFASMPAQVTGGDINFNGSQSLISGSNYFWLVYDLDMVSATIGDVLDARLNQITVGGINNTIASGAPTGNRIIVPCLPSPAGVSANNTYWLSENSVMMLGPGNRVDSWTANGITLTNSNTSQRPFLQAASPSFNYNPHVKFDGINDSFEYSLSAVDLMGSTGTVIIVSSSESGSGTGFAYKHGFGAHYQIKPYHNCGYSSNYSQDFPKWQANWDDVTFIDSPISRPQIFGIMGGSSAYNFRNGEYNSSDNGVPHGAIVQGNLTLGSNGGTGEFSAVGVAEVILYDRQLTLQELNRIQSYLAIKYGVTMGENGISKDYYSANGSIIWDASANTGFNYDIAGIGRDDIGAFQQKKSHSINGLSEDTYNDILTIANSTNFNYPTSFPNNQSYLIWGRNDQPAQGDYVFDVQEPIKIRFMRVWKAQETGFVGPVTLEFDMSEVPGNNSPIPNDLNEVRLMVNTGNSFGSGTHLVSPSYVDNNNQIVRFQHDFNATSGFYFTIGSVNISIAPLPVTLSRFNADCEDGTVELAWTTLSETNNAFFAVEKSKDANEFTEVARVNGNGTSTSTINYSWKDYSGTSGLNYYRLKQTDFDGAYEYHDVVSIECESDLRFQIYPNPTNDGVFIQNLKPSQTHLDIQVYNVLGQIIDSREISESTWINLPDTRGIYLIKVRDGEKIYTEKIVKD